MLVLLWRVPHVAHTPCGSGPTQFHPLDAIPQNIKAILPGIGISTICRYVYYIEYIYIYIEIAIPVTDGFAATQATAEHATNLVVVVANKTKNEGNKNRRKTETKVKVFLLFFLGLPSGFSMRSVKRFPSFNFLLFCMCFV